MKEHYLVGKRVPRTDSLVKATGAAKYTGDLVLPGMLYGKVLRSPHAHAKIVNIDTSKAERLPGVKAVVTGKDTLGWKWGVFRITMDMPFLAVDKVRYLGEDVAAVAAVDEDTAEEALALITVDYDPLPVILDPVEAMKEGAVKIHDHVERNCYKAYFEFGNVDEGFSNSDYVVEDKFVSHKISHSQMEPYCALASYDPVSGKIDLWVPNQSPFVKRRALSHALGIPLSKIRIRHCYMGGAFGGRTDTQPAEFIAVLLAIKSQRPVRITYTREETMMATRHKHPMILELKIGVKRDGTIMARSMNVVEDGGAYASSGLVAINVPWVMSEHVYRTPNLRYEGCLVYTNKTPCSMMRLQPHEVHFAEDSLMDKIARELGIDPVEIRLKNAIKPGEVLPSKSVVTSCAFSETIEKAVAASGYRQKIGKLGAGRGIGIGCSGGLSGFYLGMRAVSSAFIKFNEDGTCSLITGLVDNGQGNESMVVQVAAEELGIPMEDIELINGDSEITPQDPGTYPMTACFVSANAVRLAAADARRQILKIASERLGVDPEELDIRERRVYMTRNPEKAIPIDSVVRLSFVKGVPISGRGESVLKAHSKKGWSYWGELKFEGQQTGSYTFGTVIAEVEVDRETGRVKVTDMWVATDCGFAINPTAVEGQWQGGTAQCLGLTLYEKHEWDEQGRLLTDSFLDYKLPTSLDVPNIKCIIVESMDPDGPYGGKEVGLGSTLAPGGAIANAIYDAIGVRVKQLPITPEVVLKALQEKGRRK
jgi:4-hydroxybenzoyl-CoA reductase subunit alpha